MSEGWGKSSELGHAEGRQARVGDEEGAAVEDVRGMRRGDSNRISKKDTPWGGLTYCSAWRVGGSFLSIRGGFGYHKNKSKTPLGIGYLLKQINNTAFFGYLIKTHDIPMIPY